VACTVLDGRPVAVTTSGDATVRVWDLTRRAPLGDPLTGHTREVTGVACTVLDGRPVAVTTSADDTVRVWDLTRRTPLGDPLTGHTNAVTRVACTLLDGRPVAVSTSDDATVRMWDLTRRTPLGVFAVPLPTSAVQFGLSGELLLGMNWELIVLISGFGQSGRC
jgi:WD40 repeat protein